MLLLKFKNECTFFVHFLYILILLRRLIFFFQEKIECLQTLGAEVYPCPVKPWTDPDNYNHQVSQNRFTEFQESSKVGN